MKRYIRALVCFALVQTVSAQSKIEIHQIDVGTGDAALINIMNNTGGIQYSILLDAGETNQNKNVIEYLDTHAKHAGGKIYLDYVIASHYHSDHIGGLVGQKESLYTKIGNKKRKCGEVYTGVLGDTAHVSFYTVLDKGNNLPTSGTDLYDHYKSLAGNRRIAVGTTTAGNPFAVNTISPSGVYPPPLPVTQNLSLGGYVDLGADANGTPVRLRLILADSKVYYPGAPDNTYNVADTLKDLWKINLRTRRKNPNNWGIGWVLEYGAFRWYTAGDVGGYNGSYGTCTSCSSNYFDIETPISEAFSIIYQQPVSAHGHVCTQKISHHGSCCSTNQSFLDTLRSSFIAISAGSQATFGHPTQEIIDRIQGTNWNLDSLNHDSTILFLMTELHFQYRNINTRQGNTSGSVSWVATDRPVNLADTLETHVMANGDSLFLFDAAAVPIQLGDIVLKVAPVNNGFPIAQRSYYTLQYEWYEGTTLTKSIFCHGE